MKSVLMSACLILVGVMRSAAAGDPPGAERGDLVPPDAERRPVERTIHGETRIDEYAWLRDRDDSAVIAYLEAENAYKDAAMAHTKELQQELYDEMLGRIKQTDLSVPWRKGEYFHYSRTVEGLAYPIHARKKGSLDAEEQITLDVNELAEGHEYTRVTSMAYSPDHGKLAYLVDHSGYEHSTLFVKDLGTGELIGEPIEDLGPYGLAWANDSRTLFYTRQDETNRPDRLVRHVVGDDSSEDVVVFHETDPAFYLRISRTRSDQYLLMTLASQITKEVHYLDADEANGRFHVIAPRAYGVEYDVEHHGDEFLIRTNEDAINFKLMRVATSGPSKPNWREMIPHREHVYLTGVDAFENHLVFSERINGFRTLRILDTQTGEDHRIEMPERVSTVRVGRNPEYETSMLRIMYTSGITPRSVYDYDMTERELTLLKRTEVLGGYDPDDYRTTRFWATADDGTLIPLSVVHRKEISLVGDNPTLLYGYGSYGAAMDPSFRANRVSLLDRGFVFAMAHVRGGAEMGRTWYEDGKLLNKKNTFTDFIACAERLIEIGYTNPDRLAIQGGSAGGLLIGAVVNMRPELFEAAIAAVPFVDVVNTMLDPSIPLTVIEYDEWGDLNRPEIYEYVKSYAPYENVVAQRYPNILVTAGLNDPRVHYWEPAKWVARLRDRKTDDNLLLLRTNLGAGHGGASGRYDKLRETAFEYAFIIDRVGKRMDETQ